MGAAAVPEVREDRGVEEALMPMVVCAGCGSFFKIKKNGVAVEELKPDGTGDWTAYKIWMGDLYGCERCGTEIIAGFGHGPVSEHFHAHYEEVRAQLNPMVRIDDCPGAFRKAATKEEGR